MKEECTHNGNCKEHDESCCHKGHPHEFLKFLLDIADSAWKEVLKEKIKEHIRETQGEKMTELAKIVSETNSARWKHKMMKKKGVKEFKERLSSFWGE